MTEFAKDDDVAVYVPGLTYPLYGQYVDEIPPDRLLVRVFKGGGEAMITVDAGIVRRWRGGVPPKGE